MITDTRPGRPALYPDDGLVFDNGDDDEEDTVRFSGKFPLFESEGNLSSDRCLYCGGGGCVGEVLM